MTTPPVARLAHAARSPSARRYARRYRRFHAKLDGCFDPVGAGCPASAEQHFTAGCDRSRDLASRDDPFPQRCRARHAFSAWRARPADPRRHRSRYARPASALPLRGIRAMTSAPVTILRRAIRNALLGRRDARRAAWRAKSLSTRRRRARPRLMWSSPIRNGGTGRRHCRAALSRFSFSPCGRRSAVSARRSTSPSASSNCSTKRR